MFSNSGESRYKFTKFADVQTFKPLRKHQARSSFYMVAKNVKPNCHDALSAVTEWKNVWWQATFGGPEGTGEKLAEPSDDFVKHMLYDFGPQLILLGQRIWMIQADALSKTEYAGNSGSAGDPSMNTFDSLSSPEQRKLVDNAAVGSRNWRNSGTSASPGSAPSSITEADRGNFREGRYVGSSASPWYDGNRRTSVSSTSKETGTAWRNHEETHSPTSSQYREKFRGIENPAADLKSPSKQHVNQSKENMDTSSTMGFCPSRSQGFRYSDSGAQSGNVSFRNMMVSDGQTGLQGLSGKRPRQWEKGYYSNRPGAPNSRVPPGDESRGLSDRRSMIQAASSWRRGPKQEDKDVEGTFLDSRNEASNKV